MRFWRQNDRLIRQDGPAGGGLLLPDFAVLSVGQRRFEGARLRFGALPLAHRRKTLGEAFLQRRLGVTVDGGVEFWRNRLERRFLQVAERGVDALGARHVDRLAGELFGVGSLEQPGGRAPVGSGGVFHQLQRLVLGL